MVGLKTQMTYILSYKDKCCHPNLNVCMPFTLLLLQRRQKREYSLKYEYSLPVCGYSLSIPSVCRHQEPIKDTEIDLFLRNQEIYVLYSSGQ